MTEWKVREPPPTPLLKTYTCENGHRWHEYLEHGEPVGPPAECSDCVCMARTARGLAHWANVLVGATIRKVEIDVSSSGWYESGGEVESAELERLTIVGTDGKVYRLDACSHDGYGATIELRAPDPLSDATGQGRR